MTEGQAPLPTDPSYALWQKLQAKKLYTKPYDAFQKQFSTPEAQQSLYQTLSEKKLYTKKAEDFTKQFFSVKAPEPKAPPNLPGGEEQSRVNVAPQTNVFEVDGEKYTRTNTRSGAEWVNEKGSTFISDAEVKRITDARLPQHSQTSSLLDIGAHVPSTDPAVNKFNEVVETADQPGAYDHAMKGGLLDIGAKLYNPATATYQPKVGEVPADSKQLDVQANQLKNLNDIHNTYVASLPNYSIFDKPAVFGAPDYSNTPDVVNNIVQGVVHGNTITNGQTQYPQNEDEKLNLFTQGVQNNLDYLSGEFDKKHEQIKQLEMEQIGAKLKGGADPLGASRGEMINLLKTDANKIGTNYKQLNDYASSSKYLDAFPEKKAEFEKQQQNQEAFNQVPGVLKQPVLISNALASGAVDIVKNVTEILPNIDIAMQKGLQDMGLASEGDVQRSIDAKGKLSEFYDNLKPADVSQQYLQNPVTGKYQLSGFLPSVAGMVPFIASYAMGGGELSSAAKALGAGDAAATIGGITANMALSYNTAYDEGIKNGLTIGQSNMYALNSSVITSALFEAMPAVQRIKAMNSLPEYFSSSAQGIAKALSNGRNFTDAMKEFTTAGGADLLKNTGLMTGINLGNKLSQAASNLSTGKENFNVNVDDIGKEIIANAITLAPFSLLGGITEMKQGNALYNHARVIAAEHPEAITMVLHEKLDAGDISLQQFHDATFLIARTQEVLKKIPKNATVEVKQNVIPLIEEKEKIKEEQVNLDPNFQVQQNKEIAAIDEQIKGIINEPVESVVPTPVAGRSLEISEDESIVNVVGHDAEYKGTIGTIEKDAEGNFIFNDGKKEIILPVEDKTNPTETVGELGLKVAPGKIEKTEVPVITKQGDIQFRNRKYFVSFTNDPNDKVGTKVYEYTKDGNLLSVGKEAKRNEIIDEFRQEQGIAVKPMHVGEEPTTSKKGKPQPGFNLTAEGKWTYTAKQKSKFEEMASEYERVGLKNDAELLRAFIEKQFGGELPPALAEQYHENVFKNNMFEAENPPETTPYSAELFNKLLNEGRTRPLNDVIDEETTKHVVDLIKTARELAKDKRITDEELKQVNELFFDAARFAVKNHPVVKGWKNADVEAAAERKKILDDHIAAAEKIVKAVDELKPESDATNKGNLGGGKEPQHIGTDEKLPKEKKNRNKSPGKRSGGTPAGGGDSTGGGEEKPKKLTKDKGLKKDEGLDVIQSESEIKWKEEVDVNGVQRGEFILGRGKEYYRYKVKDGRVNVNKFGAFSNIADGRALEWSRDFKTIEEAKDAVTADMKGGEEKPKVESGTRTQDAETKIIDALTESGTLQQDQLKEITGLSDGELATVLNKLEVTDNKIESLKGKNYQLKKESETPVSDEYSRKLKLLVGKEPVKNQPLEVGDFVQIQPKPKNVGEAPSPIKEGFVKKVNPKKVIIESAFGGWGGQDIKLLELSFDKSDIYKHFKNPEAEVKPKPEAPPVKPKSEVPHAVTIYVDTKTGKRVRVSPDKFGHTFAVYDADTNKKLSVINKSSLVWRLDRGDWTDGKEEVGVTTKMVEAGASLQNKLHAKNKEKLVVKQKKDLVEQLTEAVKVAGFTKAEIESINKARKEIRNEQVKSRKFGDFAKHQERMPLVKNAEGIKLKKDKAIQNLREAGFKVSDDGKIKFEIIDDGSITVDYLSLPAALDEISKEFPSTAKNEVNIGKPKSILGSQTIADHPEDMLPYTEDIQELKDAVAYSKENVETAKRSDSPKLVAFFEKQLKQAQNNLRNQEEKNLDEDIGDGKRYTFLADGRVVEGEVVNKSGTAAQIKYIDRDGTERVAVRANSETYATREEAEKESAAYLKEKKEAPPNLPGGEDVRGQGKDENVFKIGTNKIKTTLGKEDEKPVSVQHIADFLSKAFNVPIRIGKFRFGKTIAGIYKRKPEIIRLKNANDLATITHEVAHDIDKEFFQKNFRKLTADDATNKTIIQELMGLDYDQKKRRPFEGYAEFMRHWMTDNANLPTEAPEFLKFWEQDFLPAHPDVAKKLETAKQMIETWKQQGAEARIIADIDRNPKHMVSQTAFSGKSKALREWDDVAYPLKEMVNKILDLSGVSRKQYESDAAWKGNDPYELASMVQKTAAAKARAFVEDKVTDFSGNVVYHGLKDIVKPVIDDMDSALAYTISLRTLNRAERGHEFTDNRIEDAKYVVDKYQDNEKFNDFAYQVTNWNRHLIEYLADAGRLSEDEKNKILDSDLIYIPFKRIIEGNEQASQGGSSKRLTNLGNPVRRFIGKEGTIVDPLEAMIQNAERIINVADKTRIVNALLDMTDGVNGIGHLIEQVPAPLQTTKTTISDVRKQLKAAGVDLGEADMDAVLTLYSAGTKSTLPPNVISAYRNGQLHYYQVDPVLYDVMTGMDDFTTKFLSQTFAGKAISGATKLVRVGSTGLRAGFQWISNPARDIITAMMQTRGHSFEVPMNSIRAIKDVWQGAEGSDMLRRAKAAGVEMSQPLGLDRSVTQGLLQEILADTVKRKAMNIVMHPLQVPGKLLDALRHYLGKPEMVPRIAEYKAIFKKYEQPINDALMAGDMARVRDLENARAVDAATSANEVTLNFKKGGKYAMIINQFVFGFNPAVRGLSKGYEMLSKKPVHTMLRGLAYITAPSVALWLMNKDEEWYQNLPEYEKALFWHFKMGDTIVRLPKPFEWGWLFGTVPEGALNSADQKDIQPMVDAFKQGETILPVQHNTGFLPTPDLLKPAAEVYFNWDLYRQRSIVPRGQEDLLPQLQYNRYTSETAKKIGDILRVSPDKIDFLLAGYTGGLATDILDGLEGHAIKSGEPSQLPVVGRLFLRKSVYTESGKYTQDFYDIYGRLNKLNRSISMIENQRPEDFKKLHLTDDDNKILAMKDMITGAANELAELRKEANELQASDVPKDVKEKAIDAVAYSQYQLVKAVMEQFNTKIEEEKK